MLGGFVGGLIVAWILSWFNVDHMVVRSVNELFNITISEATYYMVFAIIGAIGGALNRN